jgi:hypothetical protein
MCSNFGLNLHPERKPCALQWEWYHFFNRLWAKLRRRFFPQALYMYNDSPHNRQPRAGPRRDRE